MVSKCHYDVKYYDRICLPFFHTTLCCRHTCLQRKRCGKARRPPLGNTTEHRALLRRKRNFPPRRGRLFRSHSLKSIALSLQERPLIAYTHTSSQRGFFLMQRFCLINENFYLPVQKVCAMWHFLFAPQRACATRGVVCREASINLSCWRIFLTFWQDIFCPFPPFRPPAGGKNLPAGAEKGPERKVFSQVSEELKEEKDGRTL